MKARVEFALDKSTFTGILVALGGLGLGLVLEGGKIAQVLQPTAALIVFGGTLGAVLIQFPLPIVLQAISQLKDVFLHREAEPDSLVKNLLRYAYKARKEGMLSLDAELGKIQEHFPDKFKEIKVIWTSPLIPLDPLVMRKDLPPETKEKIRTFFYNYAKTDPHEKEVVMKINKLSGFKESSDKQLIPIRQIDLFGQRTKVEADAALSDGDKQAKLADIDKKLAAISPN